MAIGILLHVVVSSFTGVLFSLFFGRLFPGTAIISLLFGTLAGYYGKQILFPKTNGSEPQLAEPLAPHLKQLSWVEIVFYGFIVLVCIKQFAFLAFTVGSSIKTQLANNYGDLPLHITYIRHMASGAPFPPENPFWAFDKLRYPFGMDFYNALWESLGVPIASHLFFTGMALLFASICVLRWWGGLLLVGGFFFNGGFSGFEIFFKHHLLDFQQTLGFKNFLNSIFIPQRSVLIALPVGVFLLKAGMDYLKQEVTLSQKQIVIYGFLWGTLPFFHLYTFVIVSLILGGLALFRKRSRALLNLLPLAIPLSLVFILYLTNFFKAASLLHLEPGWMNSSHTLNFYWKINGFFASIGPTFRSFIEYMPQFWWKNLGPWLILFILLFIYEFIFNKNGNRREWVVFIICFFVFNIIILAPWDWDNIKILLWVYLGLVKLSSDAIKSMEVDFINNNKLPLHEKFKKTFIKTVFIPVYCVLFFSGSVSIISVVEPNALSIEIYNLTNLANTKGAVKNIPTSKIFIAQTIWNHSLSYWGYRIVMGYQGHLWSHGINTGDTERNIKDLYHGTGDWKAITEKLKADYIFYGPEEKNAFGEKELPFRKELKNISLVPGYDVYLVKK